MGQNKKERMWTLALKLARSGGFASCRQIEKVEFPRFDGHTLTFRGECPDAENEEPVPCGL